jgi:hypothetical protein
MRTLHTKCNFTIETEVKIFKNIFAPPPQIGNIFTQITATYLGEICKIGFQEKKAIF